MLCCESGCPNCMDICTHCYEDLELHCPECLACEDGHSNDCPEN